MICPPICIPPGRSSTNDDPGGKLADADCWEKVQASQSPGELQVPVAINPVSAFPTKMQELSYRRQYPALFHPELAMWPPQMLTAHSGVGLSELNLLRRESVIGRHAPHPTILSGLVPRSPIVPAPYPHWDLRFAPQNGCGRKVFRCPQCRYLTDRRNNLKRHVLTMHQTCSKLLECCGVFFNTKASLREHAMIFHYNGYTCHFCGRRFCRKALLKRHLSVHSGQKDFTCAVCDYATSHKSNLERHRKVHLRQGGEDDDDVLSDSCEHDHAGNTSHDDSHSHGSVISSPDDNHDDTSDDDSDCDVINVHSD